MIKIKKSNIFYRQFCIEIVVIEIKVKTCPCKAFVKLIAAHTVLLGCEVTQEVIEAYIV